MKLSPLASIAVSGLCMVLALVVVLDGPIKTSLVSDGSSKIAVHVLRKQLESFPVWASAVKLSEPDVADRSVLTSASSRFHIMRTSREVIEYYSSFAISQGWSPIESSLIQEKRFCRDGVSLMIRADRLDQGVDYTIGLTWTEQVRSPSYCPQSQVQR
jgi:hypothetical protein